MSENVKPVVGERYQYDVEGKQVLGTLVHVTDDGKEATVQDTQQLGDRVIAVKDLREAAF